MTPLNPLFAVFIFLIAFLTAYLLNLKYKNEQLSKRYETIDGMRGFLAIGVFIHHSSIWFQYLETNSWDAPKSNLFIQLGQTSVSLFFMITSFLFITKLLNASASGFDWKHFFISRIFRLAPLYYISFAIMLLILMIITGWELHVSWFDFISSLFHWGTFTITRAPVINGEVMTHLINAGVIWSLPFEWLFYCSLPLISLLILHIKPSKFFLACSFLFVAGYSIAHGVKMEHILSFAGGAIAPLLLKYTSFKDKSNTYLTSAIVLISLLLIGQFDTANNVFCKILIAIVFTFIACGNTMFGLFKNSTLRFLGDIGYSTYLLHGIILFTVIYFGIGFDIAKQYSPLAFCTIIFLITPIVVIISFLSFRFIEKPFMNRAKKIKPDNQKNVSTPLFAWLLFKK